MYGVVKTFALVAVLFVSTHAASAQNNTLNKQCRQNETEQAEAATKACTKLIDSGDYQGKDLSILYTSRCAAYVNLGKNDAALDDCTKAIKLDGKNDAAYSNRAIIQYKKDRLDETIEDATNAIRLNPNNHAAYNERANALSDKGDHDKAMRDLGENLRIKPRNPIALNNRCDEFALLRQFEAGLRDCNESLSIRPGHINTTIHRGIVNTALGRLDDAFADFAFVLGKEKDNPTALFGRGLIKLKRGETASGQEDIAAVRAKDPSIEKDFAKYGLAP